MTNINPVSTQIVKPEWIDYNGNMNVAYYTMAFDYGLDEFLSKNFGMDQAYIARSQTGPFALQSNFVYLAELNEGEEFNISVRIMDYTEKLIHLFSTMKRSRDNTLSATIESLSVFVDHNTRKSTPFPQKMYEKAHTLYNIAAKEPVPEQVGQTIGIRRK